MDSSIFWRDTISADCDGVQLIGYEEAKAVIVYLRNDDYRVDLRELVPTPPFSLSIDAAVVAKSVDVIALAPEWYKTRSLTHFRSGGRLLVKIPSFKRTWYSHPRRGSRVFLLTLLSHRQEERSRCHSRSCPPDLPTSTITLLAPKPGVNIHCCTSIVRSVFSGWFSIPSALSAMSRVLRASA
jgi:hypothetical protein